MNFITEVLSRLTDKEKNIVLNIKPNFQISLYDYITTILVKHIDETGNITINSKKISLDCYVNNIIYRNSSVIEQFLYDNGTNIGKMAGYFDLEILGNSKAKENDIDYTLTYRNNIYFNSSVESVCIKDIVGTLCEEKTVSFQQMLTSLYSNKNEYCSRNNKFLKESIDSNIEKIKGLNPINLAVINNEYYIESDGHHRVYYLLLCYLIEISKCNGREEIEKINNKYTFSFNVVKKSNNELLNMISYAMIKCNVEDLKIIEFDNDKSLIKLQLNGNIYDIRNNDELLNILKEYLVKTTNSKLIDMLLLIGFFQKYNVNIENEASSHKIL